MSEATTNKTVLGPDCRISGELTLDNDAVIMGQFKGTLRVTGMLELSESSQVAGTIIVGSLRLSGKADANVVAEDGVELLPGAALTGQLFTSQLQVVDGATFQGDVFIGANAMDQAGEALSGQNVETPEPVFDEQPTPQQEQKAGVSTVPGSVQSVLHRRRPKVLAPQGAGNGNGNGNH